MDRNIQWAEATSLQAARRTATARPLNFMIREYRGWVFVWYSGSSLQNSNKCGKPIQFIPSPPPIIMKIKIKPSVELPRRLLRSPVAGARVSSGIGFDEEYWSKVNRSGGTGEHTPLSTLREGAACKETCSRTILRNAKPHILRNLSIEDPTGMYRKLSEDWDNTTCAF